MIDFLVLFILWIYILFIAFRYAYLLTYCLIWLLFNPFCHVCYLCFSRCCHRTTRSAWHNKWNNITTTSQHTFTTRITLTKYYLTESTWYRQRNQYFVLLYYMFPNRRAIYNGRSYITIYGNYFKSSNTFYSIV